MAVRGKELAYSHHRRANKHPSTMPAALKHACSEQFTVAGVATPANARGETGSTLKSRSGVNSCQLHILRVANDAWIVWEKRHGVVRVAPLLPDWTYNCL